jgi:hypothetical protein
MPTSRESLITVLYGSTATGAPADLYDGEFAFANAGGNSKKLFIGSGGNSTANWVGAVIEDTEAINWSSVSSENNKLATQFAVKSLASNYLPLAGGSVTGDVTLGADADLVFTAASGGGTVKLQGPATTTGNAAVVLTLPPNDGDANQVLSTDGNGGLTWSDAGTATNVTVTNDDSSTVAYLAFTTASSGATGVKVDTDGLVYNASTDTLSVSGNIQVGGGGLVSTDDNKTLGIFDTKAETLNIGGAATAIRLGATSGVTTTLRGGTVVGNQATQNLFNTAATTMNFAGAATALTMGDETSATVTVRGGTLVGNTATQNLFNTTATTLNIGGVATTVSLGAATGTATINNANTVVAGDLAVNGGDLTTTQTTFNLVDATATTINLGGAATAFNAANTAAGQTVTIGGSSAGTSTYNFGTGPTAESLTKTLNIGNGATAASTTNVNIGSPNGGTVTVLSNATISKDLTVSGNLTVNGDTVTQNVSTLTVEDPLIQLASGNNATDALDIGFFGLYDTSGSQDLYCGIFRDATDGKFKLFKDSQSAPTTTVDTGATGYAVATLVANIQGGTFS